MRMTTNAAKMMMTTVAFRPIKLFLHFVFVQILSIVYCLLSFPISWTSSESNVTFTVHDQLSSILCGTFTESQNILVKATETQLLQHIFYQFFNIVYNMDGVHTDYLGTFRDTSVPKKHQTM